MHKKCPYCRTEYTEGELVDIGIGFEQVTPDYPDCGCEYIEAMREEIIIKALNKAREVLGADSAYFGKEGAEEVDNQLQKMGYNPEDFRLNNEQKN